MKGFLRRLKGEAKPGNEAENLSPLETIEEVEVNNVMLQRWERIRYLTEKMQQTLLFNLENKHSYQDYEQEQGLISPREEGNVRDIDTDELWYNSPYQKSPSSSSPFITPFSPNTSSISTPTTNNAIQKQNFVNNRRSVKENQGLLSWKINKINVTKGMYIRDSDNR